MAFKHSVIEAGFAAFRASGLDHAVAPLTFGFAAARSISDSGGRRVDLPDKIAKVWPAGPPSEALVYILAPDKLIGWTHHIAAESAADMG